MGTVDSLFSVPPLVFIYLASLIHDKWRPYCLTMTVNPAPFGVSGSTQCDIRATTESEPTCSVSCFELEKHVDAYQAPGYDYNTVR